MREQYFLLAFAYLFITSCESPNPPSSVVSFDEVKTTVDRVLNDWHLAATEANYDNYFGAMDSISIFVGTDATENWTKQQFSDFSKPYFDKGKAWDFTPFERNIYLSESGTVVWFDELLKTWMGTCIGSGILEKVGETWKIKHYVLSVKIPNESVQAVIEAKSAQDSLFLEQY